MKPRVIRVPGRVYLYITGTGWYQGQNNAHTVGGRRPLTASEIAEDEVDATMIRLIHEARSNADESLSVVCTEVWQVAYLYKEADYALSAASSGYNSLDDLADQNAARALMRRIEKAGFRPVRQQGWYMGLEETPKAPQKP